MTHSSSQPAIKSAVLPETLPLFPVSGIILLPYGRLPLNIFEPRYLTMVEAALGEGRMIGIIQPSGQDGTPSPLYEVGCAGRIVSFSETEDGRFLIHLLGVCRFRIEKEVRSQTVYRRVVPSWDEFLSDMRPLDNPDYDRERLLNVLRPYFKTHGVSADWGSLQNADEEELVSSLSMICPLPPNEKQALLEAPTLKARADMLIALLEMSCLRQNDEEGARH